MKSTSPFSLNLSMDFIRKGDSGLIIATCRKNNPYQYKKPEKG